MRKEVVATNTYDATSSDYLRNEVKSRNISSEYLNYETMVISTKETKKWNKGYIP